MEIEREKHWFQKKEDLRREADGRGCQRASSGGDDFFVHESCLQRGEKKRALVIFFYSIS